MTTPSYLGASQPAGSGTGWLARLGSYFGGGTPVYVGVGQPAPAASDGFLRGPTPAYATAPIVTEPDLQAQQAAGTAAEPEERRCPIDPEALASGHIAIVIPRGT